MQICLYCKRREGGNLACHSQWGFSKVFYTEEGAKSYASSLPGVCTVVKKTVGDPDENSMVHNTKVYLMHNKLNDHPSQIKHY